MFSRVVAVRTKEGKARQLAKTIQEKILPILESQTGFVDVVILISDTEPDQILAGHPLDGIFGPDARGWPGVRVSLAEEQTGHHAIGDGSGDGLFASDGSQAISLQARELLLRIRGVQDDIRVDVEGLIHGGLERVEVHVRPIQIDPRREVRSRRKNDRVRRLLGGPLSSAKQS